MSYGQRIRLLALLGGAAAVLLAARITQFQIAEHTHWAGAARADTASWQPVRARRGRILDARGKVLAADDAGFDLVLLVAAHRATRYECATCGFDRYFRKGDTLRPCPRCRRRPDRGGLRPADRRDHARLARLLELEPAELKERIDRAGKRTKGRVAGALKKLPARLRRRHRRRIERDHGWRPQRIASDVSYAVARAVELHPDKHPAFRIQTVPTRRHVSGPEFAHILGRVHGDVRREDSPAGVPDKVDVEVGRSGIEARFEAALRGRPGWIRILKEPVEDSQRVVERRAPLHGLDVVLTLDRAVQRRALEALRGAVGAFAVVDARTGAAVALASSPSYDPDDYARVLAAWTDQAANGRSPLVERAAAGRYAPGSILKPFTAVAGLVAGVATPESVIECDGLMRGRNGQPVRGALNCNGTHWAMTLHPAMVSSCNVYFQTLVARLDGSAQYGRFLATLQQFGVGERTGLEIERGAAPLKPPSTWYNRIAASIGQGELLVSPAQMARAYAGLLTGAMPSLHVVARVGDRDLRRPPAPLDVPATILEPIRAALRDVPRTGTVGGHGLDAWEVGCKSGTAQVARRPHKVYNAWVAGFAPGRAGRPPIGFAMVVERTPLHGGEACGPRLKEFFEHFYGSRVE